MIIQVYSKIEIFNGTVVILSISTKMKSKIINFFSDLFWEQIDQNSEFRNKQKWINIKQQCLIQKENNQDQCFRINISFIKDHILEIEFFDESYDDIEIKIYNQYNEEVYGLSIFIAPSLHIIVDMKEWLPGFYRLIIQNKSCFYLDGSFVLNEIDFHS